MSFSKDGLIFASVSLLTKQALAIAVIGGIDSGVRRWRVGRHALPAGPLSRARIGLAIHMQIKGYKTEACNVPRDSYWSDMLSYGRRPVVWRAVASALARLGRSAAAAACCTAFL